MPLLHFRRHERKSRPITIGHSRPPARAGKVTIEVSQRSTWRSLRTREREWGRPCARLLCFRVWGRARQHNRSPKAGGLVEAAQQVLGHNPLEILFLALNAVPRAPVRLYGQAREDCIDVALRDNIAALRSVMLVQDV